MEEILFYQNYDLVNVVTPVNPTALESLLIQSEYDVQEIKFLVEGFTSGFSLGYAREDKVTLTAPNLKFQIGNETIL